VEDIDNHKVGRFWDRVYNIHKDKKLVALNVS